MLDALLKRLKNDYWMALIERKAMRERNAAGHSPLDPTRVKVEIVDAPFSSAPQTCDHLKFTYSTLFIAV